MIPFVIGSVILLVFLVSGMIAYASENNQLRRRLTEMRLLLLEAKGEIARLTENLPRGCLAVAQEPIPAGSPVYFQLGIDSRVKRSPVFSPELIAALKDAEK